MKPSVARRCKDQVREDGGRDERCACVECACICACVWFFLMRVLRVCGDGGHRERWNSETEAE